jgi:hypothetical protein
MLLQRTGGHLKVHNISLLIVGDSIVPFYGSMSHFSPSMEKLNWLKIEFGVVFLNRSKIEFYCFIAFDNIV